MIDGPPADENGRTSSQGKTDTTEGVRSEVPVESAREPDEVFAALSHPRRRYLLYAVANHEGGETLATLAAEIAAREGDKPIDEVTDDERKLVHISLHHSHVPKLVDLGVISHHEKDDVVVQTRDAERVRALIESAGGDAGRETYLP